MLPPAGANRSVPKAGLPKAVADYIITIRLPTSTTNARPLGGPHSFRYGPVLVVPVGVGAHNSCLSSGLLTAMFGTAGTLMNVSKRGQNLGKACTHSLSDPTWS